jgi:hypothetical protein
MRGRVRLDLLLAGLAIVALAGAFIYRQGTSTSTTAAPTTSPDRAATAFGSAYKSVLDGRRPAADLPDTVARVRALAAAGAPIPPGSRGGRLRLTGVRAEHVKGAGAAEARITGSDGKHTYTSELGLAYLDGSWHVTSLVPPDVATVLAKPYHRPPPATALQRVARRFALAYGAYIEGVTGRPPAGLPTIESQIQSGTDPLSGTAPTRTPPRLVSVQLGPPQGNVVAAAATLAASGAQLQFSFNLERIGSQWRPWSFPGQGG